VKEQKEISILTVNITAESESFVWNCLPWGSNA
jgi:hypothetical protein